MARSVARILLGCACAIAGICLTACAADSQALPPDPGISYEENLAINPPPVQHLQAAPLNDGILLTWEPPPAVEVPHSYSDVIVEYLVYRRILGKKKALLGRTAELRYLDLTPSPGVDYSYTVTAMHPPQLESTPPDEVTARR